MEQVQAFRQQVDRIANHPESVLSIYLNVNPAHPENQGKAYLVRLKDALKELKVPRELEERIQETVELERVHYRTLVIFATPDGPFETYRLEVDLLDAFRWGEPYVAPLTLVLDEYEPYGVVLADAERFRFFVATLAAVPSEAAEEISFSGYRELDLAPSRPQPRGGGSTDLDPAGRKQESNVHRFYKELGELTRRVAFQDGIKRLILAGPKERTAEFRRTLPQELQDRVVAEENIATRAPDGEILEQIKAAQEQVKRQQETELLAKARERGVRGLDDTLSALQEENRVYHLLILWDLGGEVCWCDNDALVIQDITQKECPYCRQQTRPRPLVEALIDLAATRGARIEFLRGENENVDTLREEFGGIAGLTRF